MYSSSWIVYSSSWIVYSSSWIVYSSSCWDTFVYSSLLIPLVGILCICYIPQFSSNLTPISSPCSFLSLYCFVPSVYRCSHDPNYYQVLLRWNEEQLRHIFIYKYYFFPGVFHLTSSVSNIENQFEYRCNSRAFLSGRVLSDKWYITLNFLESFYHFVQRKPGCHTSITRGNSTLILVAVMVDCINYFMIWFGHAASFSVSC